MAATSASTVATFTAAATATLGFLGWWTTRRRDTTDAAGTLVRAGIDLATAEGARAHRCEEELAQVRDVLTDHRRRLDECDQHRRHDAEVLAVLAARSGIDLTNLDGTAVD